MDKKIAMTQTDRIRRYADLIAKQTGKAVRPYRADGYVNLMNKYGTSKDFSEQYRYVPEAQVPDETFTMFYENNGLFARVIDAPAEEAVKHGFKLNGLSDEKIEDFCFEALEELDWEETAMTAIKWARLFGGSIAVLLINDGRGLEEPVDWKNIKSIDDIRVYDRSVIQPDYQSMYNYDPTDPFGTRGSWLGMPEYYRVNSRYGNFVVHDSRCLVFQNGVLPENATNSVYQLWGMPEYIRINKAIRDAELAHRSAPKLLDRSVQAVYKMKDLAAELATEEGENRVLRRLQTIDMSRGMMNSIVIDSDGEDYDFKTFTFSGVSDVVSASCNMLSAVSYIPQVVLFGQTVGGLSTTDDTSMESWYSYVGRIQKRMLKPNLRYLLSVILQAGLSTGEVDEMPPLRVEFNPLWSLNEQQQAELDQQKAQTENTKAQTAQVYVDMQAIDPSEVRKSLADSDEFDVESMLDDLDDEDLFARIEEQPVEEEAPEGNGKDTTASGNFQHKAPTEPTQEVQAEEEPSTPDNSKAAPEAAPTATKLPQDMSEEEQEESKKNEDGGEGSGNWNHAGRPGEVGGSASSKTSRAHTVGLAELKSLKEGSKLQLGNGKVYTVTDDGDERWLESEDGNESYSLDFGPDAQSFIDANGGALTDAKVTVTDTGISEQGIKYYQNSYSDAFVAESAQDFDDYYRQQTGEIWKGLDQETKDAVADYSGHTYYNINNALRNGDTTEYSNEIERITDTIEKSELMDDTVLYRGVTTEGFEKLMGMERGSLTPDSLKQLTGTTGTEKGFMSTSSTSDGVYYKGSTVQMEILAPTGTKALYAEPFSAYNDEGGRKWNGESTQSTFSSEDETIVQRESSLTVLSGTYDAERGVYKLKTAITWQDDVTKTDSRTDGGPGSGNHNHKGVPGQVGGSAPNGGERKTPVGKRETRARLEEAGHSSSTVESATKLLDIHSGSYRPAQAEADKEIADHIAAGDEIGQYFADKAELEEQAWEDRKAKNAEDTQKHYEEQVATIREELQPGGYLSNYTEEVLKDMGLWPTEPTVVEPKVYRKGSMDGDVLAFTTNPDGANMSWITNGEEGGIGSDVEYTMSEMKAMGYRPIAGITSMDVGTIGESEVLFAKFPDKKKDSRSDGEYGSVGVLVISNGKILTGTRHNDFGYGLVCGPGGHIEAGETPEEAAIRETQEEFGITPTELIPIGNGPEEQDTGLSPNLYLCTEFKGEPECIDMEMVAPKFRSLRELEGMQDNLFKPFKDSLPILMRLLKAVQPNARENHEAEESPTEETGEAEPSHRRGLLNVDELRKAFDFASKVAKSTRNYKKHLTFYKNYAIIKDGRENLDEDEHWVTINGVHVLVDGDNHIKQGPKNLVGKSLGEITKSRSSQKGAYLDKGSVEELEKAKASGKIKMKMNKRKQSKHFEGSKKYNDAVKKGEHVGTFSISEDEIDSLVREKTGTGEVYIDAKTGHIKETVDCGRDVATYAARNGKKYPTSRITIHHSKDGYHAVPASSGGKKG